MTQPMLKPFPDAELLLVVGLTPLLQYVFGSDGIRVVTILPATIAVPTVRIKRTSGSNRTIALDRPILDADVFSSDYGISNTVSRQITVSLLALRGVALPTGVIGNVNVVQGPRWLPDADPNLYRFNASYEVFTHN
jgi:NAD(P)-dependent dehydrogenase (short-subunit alcohol dehydrogenase family)